MFLKFKGCEKLSSLKIEKVTEEFDKQMHQKVDVDARERILSPDNIKQECLDDPSNGRYQVNMFCNIVAHLLQDDIVDATKRHVYSGKDLKLAPSDDIDKPFTCNICEKKFAHNCHL